MGNRKWTLGALLEGIVTVPQPLDRQTVEGITTDSRTVKAGSRFVALDGGTVNGVDYAQQAIDQGAIAVLWEQGSLQSDCAIQLSSLKRQLGEIASRFYGDPSRQLRVAAVTGTDGKSSVAHFLSAAMERLEGGAALFGTLGNRMVGGVEFDTELSHTTPPVIELHKLLAEVVKQSGKSVALEASSHGIEQQRLSAVSIDTAILTQIGRDHLDYHGSLEHYRATKKKLFYRPELQSIVVNLDDTLGTELYVDPRSGIEVLGYSLSGDERAELMGEVVEQNREGLVLNIRFREEQGEIHSPLYGRFNGSNLLAVVATLLSWGYSLNHICHLLGQVQAVDGRMETFRDSSGCKPLLMVDYAHTAGALESALSAVREHLQNVEPSSRLWVLFGCGGERDQGKRAAMGRVAEQLADQVVLTNDNPRRELAAQILQQILKGVKEPKEVTVIEDREAAIHHCYQQAAAEDVILIAGKGHEQFQWIGEEKIALSDRMIARSLVMDGDSRG